MIMKRGLYFLGMLLCLFFMTSCAAVGALVTVTAFGVEGYEEARVHRPDLKLKPIQSHIESVTRFIRLPNIKLSPQKKNVKTSSSNAPAAFGFDCSRLEDAKKQSKCFDDFSKTLAKREAQALAKREAQALKQKYVVAQKVVIQEKEK